MKTTKGGKVMNPTDASRKKIRKKKLKRNKKERNKVKGLGTLKNGIEFLKKQLKKLEEMMKVDGVLDEARKHKKRQLEDTLKLVIVKKKEMEYEEKVQEKGEEAPVRFSHPPRREELKVLSLAMTLAELKV